MILGQMDTKGVVAPAAMNRAATLKLIAVAAQARYLEMAQHCLQGYRLLHRGEVRPASHWLSPAGAIFGSPTARTALQHMAVVEQAVQHRAHGLSAGTAGLVAGEPAVFSPVPLVFPAGL